MASRGTLAAVLLAVVLGLAVPALCDKQGASQAALAVDYHAFEKALEGLDPATRQAIGDATVPKFTENVMVPGAADVLEICPNALMRTALPTTSKKPAGRVNLP